MKESILERMFQLSKNSTTVKTEIIAGVTTFMTMAYILSLGPILLSKVGMNPSAVFTATALSAAIGTLVMAFYANLPLGLAPGIGATSFFAFTIVIAMGHTWQFALTAVLLEGILFIILTLFRVRELIINCFPKNLQIAISCGIGLFITFIGLINSGIIKPSSGTPLTLGNFKDPNVILAGIGIIIIVVLLQKQVKIALIAGIFISTLIGIPLGITKIHSFNFFSLPPSLSPIFFHFEWRNILTPQMLIVVIILLYMELFDTIGTLLGIATKAKLLDKDGNVKNIKQALMADAIATTCGACLGTATVTAYVESAAGVAQGGKTGLTAFVIGILFILSLFFAPLFLIVPSAAVSPVLIIVGLFMLTPFKGLDLSDFSEALPVYAIMIMMPFSYSIANGILVGTILYVILKVLLGKKEELNKMIVVLAILFLIGLFFMN